MVTNELFNSTIDQVNKTNYSPLSKILYFDIGMLYGVQYWPIDGDIDIGSCNYLENYLFARLKEII